MKTINRLQAKGNYSKREIYCCSNTDDDEPRHMIAALFSAENKAQVQVCGQTRMALMKTHVLQAVRQLGHTAVQQVAVQLKPSE